MVHHEPPAGDGILGKINAVYFKYAFAFEVLIQKAFHNLGDRVCANPRPFLYIPMILSALGLVSVFVNFHYNRVFDTLWIPQDSRALNDQKFIRKTFGELDGEPPTSAIYIVTPTSAIEPGDLDSERGDLLTKQQLTDFLEIQNDIEDSTRRGSESGICLLDPDTEECNWLTALDYWDSEQSEIDNDPDLHATMSRDGAKYRLGGEIQPYDVAGRVERDASGKVTKVQAFRVLMTGDPNNNNTFAWEVENFLPYEVRAGSSVRIEARMTVSQLWEQIQSPALLGLGLYILAAVLMVGYVAYVFMKVSFEYKVDGGYYRLVNNSRESRIMLGMAGILSVVGSLSTSVGLAFAAGIEYNDLLQVVPILIMAIGVDDMFVLVSSYDRLDPSLSKEERLSETLADAGTSVTMTTVTDALAFMVGASAVLPAVSSLCVVSAIAVCVDFCYQITFFVTCMYLDAGRRERGVPDPLICLGPRRDVARTRFAQDTLHHTSNAVPENKLHKLMTEYYGPFLLHPFIKVCVLLFFTGMVCFGIYGATQLDIGLEAKDIMADTSTTKQFIEIEQAFFGVAASQSNTMIVQGYYPYHTIENQKLVKDFIKATKETFSFEASSARSWVDTLYAFANFTGNVAYDPETELINPIAYYDLLAGMLEERPLFKKDLVFDPTGSKTVDSDVTSRIIASRFYARHTPIVGGTGSVAALTASREMTQRYNDLGFPVSSFQHGYLIWEQFGTVRAEVLSNFIQAIGVLLFSTLLFLTSIWASLLTVFTVLIMDVQILGVMWLWNVTLSSLSIIGIIVGIGFAIDYCAHIAHGFQNGPGDREEKAIYALGTVGGPVINGAMTTLLGLMVLALGNAEMFRILCKVLFTVQVLGLAHALVFMPVLFALVGPLAMHNPLEQVAVEHFNIEPRFDRLRKPLPLYRVNYDQVKSIRLDTVNDIQRSQRKSIALMQDRRRSNRNVMPGRQRFSWNTHVADLKAADREAKKGKRGLFAKKKRARPVSVWSVDQVAKDDMGQGYVVDQTPLFGPRKSLREANPAWRQTRDWRMINSPAEADELNELYQYGDDEDGVQPLLGAAGDRGTVTSMASPVTQDTETVEMAEAPFGSGDTPLTLFGTPASSALAPGSSSTDGPRKRSHKRRSRQGKSPKRSPGRSGNSSGGRRSPGRGASSGGRRSPGRREEAGSVGSRGDRGVPKMGGSAIRPPGRGGM